MGLGAKKTTKKTGGLKLTVAVTTTGWVLQQAGKPYKLSANASNSFFAWNKLVKSVNVNVVAPKLSAGCLQSGTTFEMMSMTWNDMLSKVEVAKSVKTMFKTMVAAVQVMDGRYAGFAKFIGNKLVGKAKKAAAKMSAKIGVKTGAKAKTSIKVKGKTGAKVTVKKPAVKAKIGVKVPTVKAKVGVKAPAVKAKVGVKAPAVKASVKAPAVKAKVGVKATAGAKAATPAKKSRRLQNTTPNQSTTPAQDTGSDDTLDAKKNQSGLKQPTKVEGDGQDDPEKSRAWIVAPLLLLFVHFLF